MNSQIKRKCLENKTIAKRIRNVTGMLSEERKCKSCEFLLKFSTNKIYEYFIGISLVVIGICFFFTPLNQHGFYPFGLTFILMATLFALTILANIINAIQLAQLSYVEIVSSFIDVPPKILKGVYQEFDAALKSLK